MFNQSSPRASFQIQNKTVTEELGAWWTATVITHLRSKFGRSDIISGTYYRWYQINSFQLKLIVSLSQTRASQLIGLLIIKMYWCMCIGELLCYCISISLVYCAFTETYYTCKRPTRDSDGNYSSVKQPSRQEKMLAIMFPDYVPNAMFPWFLETEIANIFWWRPG